MRITEITINKEMKIGLPSYSNITIGIGMTYEIKEGEDVDWDKIWDICNQQLAIQAEAGKDPSWIHRNEYKNDYKVTVKVPKT